MKGRGGKIEVWNGRFEVDFSLGAAVEGPGIVPRPTVTVPRFLPIMYHNCGELQILQHIPTPQHQVRLNARF